MAPGEVLVLKANCTGCGATADLYGSTCKHMTLCIPCGKTLVETGGTCTECGVPITRLIREYNVKHHIVNKNYFVGRFHQGIPHYSKKKNSEAKWSMQRDGLQGRQLTDTLREKYKNKPWILEDDIGQQQFTGQLEGGQQATYFLLIMQGADFVALPAGNWYNFHKVAHYKQLTLEEAEEQMKNRRKTADGYQRWMMKVANTGAAAFGVGDSEQIGGISGSGARTGKGNDEDGNGADSDKAEEDEDEEEARKHRLGMNKGAAGDEDGEEPALDLDIDDDEGEKGDDWEHEETFTDDDEAVGNDADEREDQVNPEVPPPPEIKQEEEDEEEGQENPQEEQGGLSKSGKELKKLLGKVAKEDDSDGVEDDDGTDEDVDLDNEDIGMSPVLAPTRKEGPKVEPTDGTPAKPTPVAKSTPPSASAGKGKRKAITEEPKANGAGAAKKAKTETAKATPPSAATKKDVNAAVKAATTPSNAKAAATNPSNGKAASTNPSNAKAATTKPAAAPNQAVTEEEVMKVLRQTGPIKSTDLVAKFRSRLRTSEDKAAFAAILKKISRIQKTDGANYIVLQSNLRV